MNEQQKDYLDAMDEMMKTKGWSLLVTDLTKNQEAIKESIMSQADLEKFFIAKGRFLTLGDIIGLEAYLDSARKNLVEQETEDALV